MARSFLEVLFSSQTRRSKRTKKPTVKRQRVRAEHLEKRQLLAAEITGWVGSYFTGGTPGSSPDLVRHDALIDFDWGERSALNNTSNSDGSSARWESNLQSDHTATHQLIFRLEPQDGLRLWVDGQNVVDAWSGAGSNEIVADVPLVANQATPVRIEFRDISGASRLWLGWTSPELPREVVGPEWTQLSTSQTQTLDAAAPTGVLFEQLSAVASDYLDTGEVAFDAIASGTFANSTSVSPSSTTHPAQRLRSFLVPETSGNYQFRISGGDASRLLIADDATPELSRTIASTNIATTAGQWNGGASQTSAPVSLVAGLQYYLEARQTDSSGTYDGLQIQWSRDGSAWTAIPNAELRSFQAEVGVRAIVSSVNETDTSNVLTFDVFRSDDFGRDLPVSLDFGGTTTRGVDYTGATSTVTIPKGQRSARVSISVVSDGIDEVRETIKVGVSPSSDYRLTSPIRARTTLSIFGNVAPVGSSLIGDDPALVSSVDEVQGINPSALSNRTAVNENNGSVNGDVLIINTTSSSPTVAVRWDATQDITEPETVYAEFYYRRVGGPSWNPFTFELQSTTSSATWGTTDLTATGVWQRAQIPITPGEVLSAGSLRAELRLNNRGVSVEIANFQVTRFVESLANATSVLPANPVLISNIDQRSGQNSLATFSNRTTAAAENVPFTDVLRVDVNQTGRFRTSVAARWKSDTAIEAGSILKASIWLRSDDAPFEVRFEIAQDSVASRLMRSNLQVTNQWQKYEFNLQADAGSVIGAADIGLFFGQSLGRLEVGDIQFLDQGTLPDLTEFLPQDYSSYAQRDADSDWRASAQQSVLENRRNELVVNVTNLAGVPIPGAIVEVNQEEHAYRFGNIIRTEYVAENLSSSSTDESLRHQAIASRLFNSITVANGIRWVPWENNELTGRNSVDWVNENVRDLHGHHLTWGNFDLIPNFVEEEYLRLQSEVSQQAAVDYLRQAQLDHVAEIASELGGTIEGTDRPKITSWDVANHPTLIRQVWNILRQGGPLAGPVGEVFDIAAANAHPDTVLMVNEGQTIEAVDNPIRQQYFNLVQDLLAAGKPVEGIGFMNHFNFYEASSPTQLKTYLDEFASLGLPLLITEFDIDATGTDHQTQADWSEDYFLNVFSNPATTGIISYGFWEPAHWRRDVAAHWYDSNWEAKPNADVFVDQIRREWQTNTVGSTRFDGSYRTMAFDGTHQVTVQVNGQSYLATAQVDASGGLVNVVVDAPTLVTEGTRVEFENYNSGGQGVGYFDTTDGNTGGAYRPDQDVDIGVTNDDGDEFFVGWVADNEWLNYTVDVVAGTYSVDFRVATPNSGRSIELFIAENDSATEFSLLGSVAVPNTGGFGSWETVTMSGIDLSPYAGSDRVIRVQADGQGINLNWFEFNQPMAAIDDAYSIGEDLELFVPEDGLLSNDLAGSMGPIGVTPASNVATSGGGTVTLFANGSFQYTPAIDFVGVDTFDYQITGSGNGNSDTATVSITVVERLEVESIHISKDPIERDPALGHSIIDVIKVTLDGTANVVEGAFAVETEGGQSVPVLMNTSTVGGKTTTELTFAPNATSDVNAFGSLIDGSYKLIIDGSKITRDNIALDANNSGTPGTTYEHTDGFYSKYADVDGSGTVSLADFATFRATFGKNSNDSGFVDGMDYNRDGNISLVDFAAFRAAFGK